MLLQKLTYESNDKIYFPQELRNRQLLSCKISYKIQLKNLKYLHPQSLTCKVYQQQENQIKYLLPQSRRTRKIIDKMQQRKYKFFSRSHFCAKSTIKCIKTKYKTPSYSIFCCSQSRASSLKSDIRKEI